MKQKPLTNYAKKLEEYAIMCWLDMVKSHILDLFFLKKCVFCETHIPPSGRPEGWGMGVARIGGNEIFQKTPHLGGVLQSWSELAWEMKKPFLRSGSIWIKEVHFGGDFFFPGIFKFFGSSPANFWPGVVSADEVGRAEFKKRIFSLF